MTSPVEDTILKNIVSNGENVKRLEINMLTKKNYYTISRKNKCCEGRKKMAPSVFRLEKGHGGLIIDYQEYTSIMYDN